MPSKVSASVLIFSNLHHEFGINVTSHDLRKYVADMGSAFADNIGLQSFLRFFVVTAIDCCGRSPWVSREALPTGLVPSSLAAAALDYATAARVMLQTRAHLTRTALHAPLQQGHSRFGR
jgi:hypothetical protein